jgi:hypothetical protein
MYGKADRNGRSLGVDAVAEHVVGGAVRHAEDRVEGGAIAFDDRAKLDVGHVVGEATAVREAAQVAIDGAQPLGMPPPSTPNTHAPAAFGLMPGVDAEHVGGLGGTGPG